jgi:hypothetical protein
MRELEIKVERPPYADPETLEHPVGECVASEGGVMPVASHGFR